MKSNKVIRSTTILLALTLGAAACGDDGGDGEAADPTTTLAPSNSGSTSPNPTSAPTTVADADPLEALGISIDSDCPSDYDPTQGVTDTEISIGQSVPKTGPSAAFSLLSTGLQAYFDYANAELDGVNGRDLKLTVLDDAYEPGKTTTNVNELIADGVFATSGILGTANNIAVRDVLNDECIPHLYPATGSTDWADVEDYPWTVSGAVVPYNVEAKIWADYLVSEFPNGANVVALQMGNAFGAEYETWFKKYIEGTNIELTKVEKHDPASTDVTNQITTLAATGADVVIHMTTSSACISAMAGVGAAAGWTPLQIVSGTCKSSIFFAGAKEASKDAIIVSSAKEITYPIYDSEPDIVTFRANLTKYVPEGTPISVSLVPNGWLYGEILRDTLLRAEEMEGGLTRPNVLLAARETTFTSPYYYDGVTLNLDGINDPFMIEAGQVERWNGTAFEVVSELYQFEGTMESTP